MPKEDHTRGQLDPTEIVPSGAVEATRDPPELGKERMAALHGATNPTDPRLTGLAPFGRLHPKACGRRSFLARAIAVRSVGPRPRQVTGIGVLDQRVRRGWPNHQRPQDSLGLRAVVDVSCSDHGPQRQAIGVTRYMDGRTTLTAIHRRWPGVGAPFFDGFLEPSRRT